jgi:hypothetical protein
LNAVYCSDRRKTHRALQIAALGAFNSKSTSLIISLIRLRALLVILFRVVGQVIPKKKRPAPCGQAAKAVGKLKKGAIRATKAELSVNQIQQKQKRMKYESSMKRSGNETRWKAEAFQLA